MSNKQNVINEITPLTARDCFYVADRRKDRFGYPLHCHDAYEINYVQHGRGAQRIVGDSVETIGDYDLVLIANPQLPHAWAQGECTGTQIHEITIQLQPEIFPQNVMVKRSLEGIAKMFKRAHSGLVFSMDAIMRNHQLLEQIAVAGDEFERLLSVWRLLYQLSEDTEARELSTSAFMESATSPENDRIHKVERYVHNHYFEEISLEDLAGLVNMTTVSFSRFFKLHTGRTFSEYLINIRLGYAAHELVSTTASTADIAYRCGFNNLSNFNRLFRKYKQMSPSDFKRVYKKNTYII